MQITDRPARPCTGPCPYDAVHTLGVDLCAYERSGVVKAGCEDEIAYARSADPNTTVTAEVYVRNLIVLGSLPPVIRMSELDEARAVHGDAYVDEAVAVMRRYGHVVTTPSA